MVSTSTTTWHPCTISPRIINITYRYDEEAFDVLELHSYVNPDISRRQLMLLTLFDRNRCEDFPVITTAR